MKRLLIVAVTLSITTGAMAQEGDGRVILPSYEGRLDAKSQAKLDKLVTKEREQMRQDSIARAEYLQDSINSANEAAERRSKQANDEARARASLKLAKSSQTVSYEAGSYELSFTLQSPYDGLRVTAEDNQSWITIDDIGAKKLYYSVAENNTTSNRSGVITLMYNDKSYKFTVTQGYFNVSELCNQGVAYYNQKNYTEAVKYFRQAAEQGNAYAQYNLGYCYYNGNGVTKDYTKAVEWYRKAAEQGHADAQNYLGYCYEKGYGVPENDNKAVEWYRKAAEQGNARAQNNLGYCYEKGYGVPQDYNKAVEWYRKAAEQGQMNAQCNLGYCYYNGYGVTQDYSKAVEWFRKAARQGETTAQNNLRKLGESW